MRASSPAAGTRQAAAAVAPILFCDRGCPFAHRVLALLEHLGCPFDRRESLVGSKPEGLDHYSASGRIPLLVHADLVLTESRVMLEYLAERYDDDDAYPNTVGDRARHRHAMAVTDAHLAPRLVGREQATADDAAFDETLRVLEVAAESVTPRPCLLALHVAPLWLAFQTWRPGGAVERAIRKRRALCSWLDTALELDCLAHTAPDPKTFAQDMARAREAGLVVPAAT